MDYGLDDLELAGDGRKPFAFVFPDGDRYVFKDPKKISWKILTGGSLIEEMTAGCPRYADLLEHDEVDGEFIGALLLKWRTHYGVTAPGEPAASSPSSDATAGPSTPTSPSAGSTSPSSGAPAAGKTSSTSSTTSPRTRPTAKRAPKTTSSSSAST